MTCYYGEWQSAYENLDIPYLHLQEGLPTSFDAGKCNVVVLDDLMAETDGRVTDLFTKKEEPPLQHVRNLPRAESIFEKQGESHN